MQLRKIAISLFLSLVIFVSPLNAFDTYWHSEASNEIGHQLSFSEDAIKTLQLASFAVDYFWVFLADVESTIEKGLSLLEFKNTPLTTAERNAAKYLHFDNLKLQLDENWKFDYLWQHLKVNTQKAIAGFYNDNKLKNEDKNRLILLTLGASLHAVEDFYCHSDWIHNSFGDFIHLRTDNGKDRAPTWFEYGKKFGYPRDSLGNWTIHVSSGIFPPQDNAPKSSMGIPLSHTTMNHDNSQLFFAGESQMKYHSYGLHPATDSISIREHQAYAYRTAVYAATEWIKQLEEDSDTKTALEFAKKWDLSKIDHDVKDDLEDGLDFARSGSCILQKWDGAHTTKEIGEDCTAGKIISHPHLPKQSNIFWGSFPKYNILQKLTDGMGDKSGNYTFTGTKLTEKK
jgi:hypothetical protein